jgi:hypothetical protein
MIAMGPAWIRPSCFAFSASVAESSRASACFTVAAHIQPPPCSRRSRPGTAASSTASPPRTPGTPAAPSRTSREGRSSPGEGPPRSGRSTPPHPPGRTASPGAPPAQRSPQGRMNRRGPWSPPARRNPRSGLAIRCRAGRNRRRSLRWRPWRRGFPARGVRWPAGSDPGGASQGHPQQRRCCDRQPTSPRSHLVILTRSRTRRQGMISISGAHRSPGGWGNCAGARLPESLA